jgi:hypothetical protein
MADDVLMTVCTYDDVSVAQEHARQLLEAGIQAKVAPCLMYDPEQPDAELVDLVVSQKDVARAQAILGTIPSDYEPIDGQEDRALSTEPVSASVSHRWMAWICLILIGLASLVSALNAFKR